MGKHAVLDGQLALFVEYAPRAPATAGHYVPDALFLRRHQVGQYRLPWDTASGRKAGELVPAWRCCRCGAIEMSPYCLVINHGCEDLPDGCRGSCRYTATKHGTHRYRMDEHWIPPAGFRDPGPVPRWRIEMDGGPLVVHDPRCVLDALHHAKDPCVWFADQGGGTTGA